MKPYNGHKSYDYWNVSLWINNDEGLYRHALSLLREEKLPRLEAARRMLDDLHEMDITHTPDGARYNIRRIYHAMEGMV